MFVCGTVQVTRDFRPSTSNVWVRACSGQALLTRIDSFDVLPIVYELTDRKTVVGRGLLRPEVLKRSGFPYQKTAILTTTEAQPRVVDNSR